MLILREFEFDLTDLWSDFKIKCKEVEVCDSPDYYYADNGTLKVEKSLTEKIITLRGVSKVYSTTMQVEDVRGLIIESLDRQKSYLYRKIRDITYQQTKVQKMKFIIENIEGSR